LQIGDPIGVSRPWPPKKIRSKRLPGKTVNLISFGVGITEAIMVAKVELGRNDAEIVTLLYANRYKGDAFFRDELEALKARYPRSRSRLVYLYSREEETDESRPRSCGKSSICRPLPTNLDIATNNLSFLHQNK